VRVFLGITGASGAPYAKRLVQALTAADCELGVCASSAGVEVLAVELYGDAQLSRDEVLARLTDGCGESVTIYDPNDWRSPYASGSAKVDAYLVCPCSSGTLGAIASGLSQNLIQRAASVALKEERKLVLCPRETPLSAIHLENMLTLRRAGATILFLAPGFYGSAETVADLVDFVVARALDQLGLANVLAKRWGTTS
jgi:4-hydroxy-3-polyprenylbenzoate decarboxylase